ncbi:MAG: CvpA family protein [Muribaculaceae bacterium]|nr:CvpA family protein [Muribaculaceae bacterium]
MTDALFHIIAIIVAILGVVRGYRRGLTGMVTSVFGLAFGVVCAHIFCDGASEVVAGVLPSGLTERSGYYLTSNLGAGAVYFIIYYIFRSITNVIRQALESDGSGLLNSLTGAFFCVSNYLLMLSIAYNIGVGLNPSSQLMRHGRADDGNIIEAVMWIAPAALGSESFSEFALEEQLRHARTISQNGNRRTIPDVITKKNNPKTKKILQC